jgi:hypothetical protein
MITPNGGVFGRNPKFNNVTVDGNLTVNGDIALGDDIVVTDTLTVNGITTLASTTDSTTKDNGALIVDGGVGIEKRLNVGGQVSALATTASNNTTTGALVVTGGVGVAGAINAGAASSIAGNLTLLSGNGASTIMGIASALLATTSGSSVSATDLIPANCVVLGVSARVIAEVTGATDFDIGDGSTVDMFGDGIAVAAGTVSADPIVPEPYAAATDVVLTANGGNFTAGSVRVSVHYIAISAPTG